MTYQVLARKWRPQDFRSLVGQQPIVTALRNALTEDRIAQAYIFSGIRGVGKTTTARVLAKALNCPTRAEQKGADPCNECGSCREITSGGDLDVIEVDAATYSKVEQVRELTESLRYAPANDRYKVVVLDEVHRLSRQAFDALLKIVEEPPPHLVFIFATTELDAVPATILSRCQQFQFRRVAVAELSDYLGEICQRESITASEGARRLIARAAEGSVRDAIALLDQLATFGQGTIEDEAAHQLIGSLDSSVFRTILRALLGGDATAVRAQCHEIEQYGWDPYKVYGQFLTYLRDALHLAMPGGGAHTLDLPVDEAKALGELVRPAGYENLLRLLTLLLDAEETVRRSEFANLALEVTWLRAAELPKLTSIETLLAGGLGGSGGPSGGPTGTGGRGRSSGSGPGGPPLGHRADQSDATSGTTPDARATPARRRTNGVRAGEAPAAAPAPQSSAPPSPPIELDEPIAARRPTGPPADPSRFLAMVRQRRAPLAAHLRGAHLTFASGALTINVATDDPLVATAVGRANNATLIDELVTELWGADARWQIQKVPADSLPSPAERPKPTTSGPGDASLDPTTKHPIVKALLDVFSDGTVESVRPHESDTASAVD